MQIESAPCYVELFNSIFYAGGGRGRLRSLCHPWGRAKKHSVSECCFGGVHGPARGGGGGVRRAEIAIARTHCTHYP